MTWHTGSPQITPRSCSSVVVCATTPSLSLCSTVFFPSSLAFGSPDRNTTIRPALLSVPGGTCHTGPELLDVLLLPLLLLLLLLLSRLEDLCEDLLVFEVVGGDPFDFLPCDFLPLASSSPFRPSWRLVATGEANRSKRLRTYALSARTTGSPSLTKERNKLFTWRDCRRESPSGAVRGSRLTGGAPKVTQWILRKQPVRVLSSDSAARDFASMWLYRRAATAPPALCPVISSECDDRPGSSSSSWRRRRATGPTIRRAAERKPVWQKLPASSYNGGFWLALQGR